jgi:uncharacterized membrane-anchored protein YjiN (DUF445 family)
MSETEKKTLVETAAKAGGVITDPGIDHPDLSGMSNDQVKSQVALMVSALNKMWENDKEIFMQKFIDNILSSIKEDTRAAIKEYVNEAIDENLKTLDPEMKAQLLKEMVDKALSNLPPEKVQEILKSESATKVPTDDETKKATSAPAPDAAASGGEKLETDDDKAKTAPAAEVSDDATKSSDLTQTLTDPKAAATALQGQGEEMVGDAVKNAQEEAKKKIKDAAGPLGAFLGGARSTRRRKSKTTKRRKQTKHRRQTMKR